MDLCFLGAAREVTGSRYLLSTKEKNILIDCGMEQGHDTYENQELPVMASEIECLVLTHAHIDHSGMVPRLFKEGFRGPVYATKATTALCGIMLKDSAHIQEYEAEWRNRKAKRAGSEPYVPIYTMEDAEGVLKQFKSIPYNESFQILENVSLVLTDAGHLLGSASATLQIQEKGETRRIVFSGDIGNLHQPIIKDPHYLKEADYVVMESTYGDRLHGKRPDYIADLCDVLQTTFDRGGKVVIPSFAIGRSQEMLYFLREIKQKKLIKGHEGWPVFMDSPLAIKATSIFNQCDDTNFDKEMRDLIDRGINPLHFDDLQLCVTPDESKAINFHEGPGVIISASGMAEAGRIRHHLKHNLWKPEATILFVGYQSVGTLGRLILEGLKEVRLFDDTIHVQATIRSLQAISGHADADGLFTWAQSFDPKPLGYFICHGEESVALTFAKRLEDSGLETNVPYNGDVWDLVTGLQTNEGNPALVRAKKRNPSPQTKAPSMTDRKLQSASDRMTGLLEKARSYSNNLKSDLAEQLEKVLTKWE
ncbi:MAG: MBL fold metallo-hydrolase [Clostridiales bacterium]|nr:MBL fold metallo-hydrolase [Clostridiales bacterium]